AMHDLRAALASERKSFDTSQRTLTLPSPGVPGEGSERAAKGDEADKQVLALARKVKTAAAGLESKESGDAKVAAVVAEIDRVSGASTAADLTKLGPGSDAAMRASNGAIRWSPSVDGGGEQVTYRALLSTDQAGRVKEDVTLVFR